MTKFIRSNETISGQIDEDLVMVDIEKGKYFSLNSVATRIWQLLENSLTQEELCSQLLQEYDVSTDQCRVDVEDHLVKMQQLGLVKIAL